MPPVFGSIAMIVPRLVDELNIKQVVLAIDQAQGKEIRRIMDVCSAIPVKAQIVDMAGQFVAGQTGEDLLKQIKKNTKLGLATTIDLLGETVLNDAEADIFLKRNLEILDSVSKFYAKEPEPCFSDLGPKAPLPRLNLSVKISALTPDVHPADPENSIAALKERFP